MWDQAWSVSKGTILHDEEESWQYWTFVIIIINIIIIIENKSIRIIIKLQNEQSIASKDKTQQFTNNCQL